MTAYRITTSEDYSWLRPAGRRKASPFTSGWDATHTLLEAELTHLKAKDVTLAMDVHAGQIRRDGMLYADARPGHPGLILSFSSQHGDLTYRADAFLHWIDNLRGIALSLEKLRAVGRYGVLQGEQYVGSMPALAAGSGSWMPAEKARELLAGLSGALWIDQAPGWHLRRARAAAHPDRNDGQRVLWDSVETAAKVLQILDQDQDQ